VCEASSFEPICATVQADTAVAPLLVSTVPDGFHVIITKLPRLRSFSINLYKPRTGPSEIAAELARHIREQLAQRAA
jgi:hypothetical protein